MKKIAFPIMIAAIVFAASCKEKKETNSTMAGMMEVDLSGYEYNFPFTIQIPDSSNGKVQITPQSWGAVEITVGDNFQLSMQEGTGELVDMTFQKSSIAGDDVKKLKRYLVDEPTTIVYESEIPGVQSEFHFYTIIKVGETQYIVKNIEGTNFNEAAITKMLESAKSIKPKQAAAAKVS